MHSKRRYKICIYLGHSVRGTTRASMAVFILKEALSVQTDNASMVVFILRTHYPTGRRIMRLDELSFEIRLERRTTKGPVRLDA